MKLGHALGLVWMVSVVCACGAAPSRTPRSAPYAPAGESKAEAAPQAAGQMPAAPEATSPGQEPAETGPWSAERGYAKPPPTAGSAQLDMSKSRRDLLEDFAVAEAAMLSAGSDCTAACRALRSMQRAAARLCSIASNDDERDRCRAAQDRVRAARDRVRSSCGQCTGGPSLDPNAPVDEP